MVTTLKPSQMLDDSRRIERKIYTDPDVYRLEMERVFRRAWHFVGLESELASPRDYITATIGEEPVIVTRNNAGQLRGFFNACTHRAAVLTWDRRGSCPAFRCMYHGWTFDLEGRLTGVPYPDAYGEDFDRTDYNVPPIAVQSFAGMIWVSIEPKVATVKEYLGEIGQWVEEYCQNDLEVLGRVRWRYPGNWKLWHENFADNYHPEFVHKTIGEGYKGVEVSGWNYRMDDGHGLLLFPIQSQRRTDRQNALYVKALGRDIDFSGGQTPAGPSSATAAYTPPKGHAIITVFPTLDIQSSLGPNGPLPVLQVVHPQGVDSTIVEAWALNIKGSPPEVRQRRLDRAPGVGPADFISADDNEAVTRCQVGALATGVPFSNMSRGQRPGNEGEKRDEYSLRSFYRGWHMYMDDPS